MFFAAWPTIVLVHGYPKQRSLARRGIDA
ncbi:hypothetical protein CBM2608_A160121 [Cupriavidus taiwanensis]|nr:hypothetical protein CBM2608_A160121 [Cupriavidus taiwanensis]